MLKSNIAELKKGQKIVFTKKPLGSWARVGETYIVEDIGTNFVYFRSASTGGGTYDPFDAIRYATWIEVVL